MAPLLSRLFNNRKRCLKDSPSFELTPDFKKWYPPDFNSQSQVRVLLFRDCDYRGRKLLFDSSSIKKKQPPDEVTSPKKSNKLSNVKLFSGKSSNKTATPPPKSPPPVYVEVLRNGETYEYLPKMADVLNFGEMMFGSVALSTQGTTKVHIMKSPPRLMITIVFPQMPSESRTEMVSPTSSLHNSTSEICISRNLSESLNLAHSVPVDVPVAFHRNRTITTDSLQSQLNVSMDSCTSSSLPRSSSFTNLQRRILRNMSTSIELNLQKRSNSGERLKGKNKLTLGLGVIISLSETNPEQARKLQTFFFSHILLIENHVLKLKQIIEENFYHPISLTPFLYQGVIDFRLSIQDLIAAPRLLSPAWLGILSSPSTALVSQFVTEFASLLNAYDTKSTNFFVSTLLSVVLSNHLSWVTTVVPSNVLHSRTSYQRPQKAEWIDNLAKSHPYNPLWMQLADLYGAVGNPFKLAQTVVVGSNKDLIQRFLFLLSYFIRCSDLCEKVYQLETALPITEKSLISCSAPTSSINTLEKKAPLTTKFKNLDDWDVNDVYFPKPPLLNAVDFQLGESPADSKTAFVNHPLNQVNSLARNGLEDQLLEETILIEQRLEKVIEEEPSLPEEPSQMPTNSLSVADQGRLYIQEYQSLRFAPERCTGGLSPTHPPQEPKLKPEIVVQNGIPLNKLPEEIKEFKESSGSPREDSSEEGYHSLEESKKPTSPVKTQSIAGKTLGELLSKQTVPIKAIDLGYTKLIEKETRLNMDLCETLGWSLMASVTDHFLTDFCLQGIQVQHSYSCDEIQKNLIHSVNSPMLGEPIDEAVCIVADVDNLQVSLLSSQRCGGLDVMMSPLVASICDSVKQMRLLNIDPDICVMHLEDKLQELFNLSETLRECTEQEQDLHHVINLLNLDIADLPLLYSTASCHNLFCMDSL